MRARLSMLIGLGLASGLVGAQQIYKYIDAEGNVTYSQEAPPDARNVETIRLRSGPTPTEQQQAQERLKQMEESMEKPASAEKGATEPPRQTRQQRVAAAKANLEAAERRLEQAKQIGPGDRQGTASGGSRFTESYRKRVEAAESEVDAARQRLEEAQGPSR